jgi:hypothetical protein
MAGIWKHFRPFRRDGQTAVITTVGPAAAVGRSPLGRRSSVRIQDPVVHVMVILGITHTEGSFEGFAVHCILLRPNICCWV